MFRNCLGMLAATAVAALTSSTALASPALFGSTMGQIRLATSSQAPVDRFVFAPSGAVRFCLSYQTECEPGDPARIVLDESTIATLDKVNRSVNARITPTPDVPGEDRWELYKTEGDCDDYVAQKRHELRLLGFPASALLLAAGTTSQGEAHLVLMVLTDRGEYILDNLTNQIRPWNRAGIRWISRQSPFNPTVWQAIGGAPARKSELQVAAVRVASAVPSQGAVVQGPHPSL